MKISQTQKVIFAVIMFIATGFVLYYNFFAKSNSGVVATETTGANQNQTGALTASTTDQTEGQDILNLASKLGAISIDSSLFESPLFKGLKDFDAPLSPETQGRPDPFAAIGSDVGTQNIQATTTKK